MTQEQLQEVPTDILFAMLKFAKQKEQQDIINAEFKRRGIDLYAKIKKPTHRRLDNKEQ